MNRSLKSSGHILSDISTQLELIETANGRMPFRETMRMAGLYPLKPENIDVFQVNLGKMCNQACRHCHVDAGPDRKEIMTRGTMQQCLDVIAANDFRQVDITGGAPEMNPEFRWFVEACRKLGKHVMVRCNLTIITAGKRYQDLPRFYRDHSVEVISSLPFYEASKTDRQRGEGVFGNSIRALKLLNEEGYAQPGSGLMLNLVYNPAGAFLPDNQESLKRQFKQVLKTTYGIDFNDLYAITNIPINRYLEYLLSSGNYEAYMEKLVNAFNPIAAAGVMCRNTLSVGWDGQLYDCDFNQMLDLKIDGCRHISEFNMNKLRERNIILNEHCYACTAGSGSSCGGATV